MIVVFEDTAVVSEASDGAVQVRCGCVPRVQLRELLAGWLVKGAI